MSHAAPYEERYPIGEFVMPDIPGPDASGIGAQIDAWIDQIAAAPGQLRAAVAGLDESRLETPYREGGWTVRQVVHHLPDSHMNAYVRMKLALTEERPLVSAYNEVLWSELADVRKVPVGVSLDLIEALHARWVALMRGLRKEQRARVYLHPESGPVRLYYQIGSYAWHGRHHVAHVTRVRERMGW